MSKIFVPRPYQKLIIDHIQRNPRCNVFAPPGLGKTASTLAALDALDLSAAVFPALVLGPLRVANSVWNREVEKWARLKGLRVVRVLGTPEQRRQALRTPADIYTTHYGLLTWLLPELGGKWPFRTVVADESTRLKSQRCSYRKHPKSGKISFYEGGAVNAATLAKHAHRSPQWINLTGTPAANGLKDLWGQHWFVDYGSALGNSYDAFTRRWFFQRRGTSAEQAVFEPLPHAHDEITSRIAPSTISLDAYEWFDCERPREVCLPVYLDDASMKEYRKLHRTAVLELSDLTTITAVSAGVVTNKCLQYACGNIVDNDGQKHHIHDHKLDALESLVENLGGAPLLVGYTYTADRDAILKRFPQAELLPSGAKQAEVEDRWNQGRIPMLVVHPASAGHGLNLQYGGHNVCFYGQTWDLELREQLIERVGPVRQMQAGFDRIVSVYNLIAEGTFDETVFARTQSKATVQQAIMEAVRVR
jgi:SNF2 family DNA or RNA helicase